VSYPSAKASELPDSTTILDSFHPKSCPLPLGRSVTEVSISTGVYSDRTDPTVSNSMWTNKLFYRGKSMYLLSKDQSFTTSLKLPTFFTKLVVRIKRESRASAFIPVKSEKIISWNHIPRGK